MRSPLVLQDSAYKYRHVLRTIIPKNTSRLMFLAISDMELEYYYSAKYDISCSTYDYRLYDFWKTYLDDPIRVLSVAELLRNKINLKSYDHLQKLYYKEPADTTRAAMFLILNRCSFGRSLLSDSFDLKAMSKLTRFIETHSDMSARSLNVSYKSPIDPPRSRCSFIIYDMRKLEFTSHIKHQRNFSFATPELLSTLEKQEKWCLLTNPSLAADFMKCFDFYYLTPDGKRSLSETNKIIFFNVN